MTDFLPETSSLFFYLILIVLIMIFHILLGSSLTTLSIMIPSIMAIVGHELNPLLITFLCYTTVSLHYLLPFHHVTVMIGAGSGYYSERHTLRFGFVMTIVLLLAIPLIFLPWWKFIAKII